MTEPRQPRLLGTAFALRDAFPWPEFVQLAREGEGLGYAAVFLPEIGGQRDTLVALGGLAGETEDLRLGTGIIPMSSRTPSLTAMAAATVQERSSGRLVLGIGTGPAVPGALDRLRDLVVMIRRLLAGEVVQADGRTLSLSLVPDVPVPIWMSALGPRAMRVAAEVADGVLLNWCTPERVARRTGGDPGGSRGGGTRSRGRDRRGVCPREPGGERRGVHARVADGGGGVRLIPGLRPAVRR